MEAKALYGAQNGLDASLRADTRAGLELPPADSIQVISRLVRQANASRHWR
jgi:hypothetical protein